MQRLADVEEEENDPIAFLEALKLDLGQDEVYLFTPKGRVIALIEGATPIDFAYAVHTEVGHRCVGAKVNGRLVPLDTVLRSADVVEIVTSKNDNAGPVARLAEHRPVLAGQVQDPPVVPARASRRRHRRRSRGAHQGAAS